MDQQILFKEIQRFRQWWIWLILIFINSISAWVLLKKYVYKHPFTDTNYHSYSGAEIPIFVTSLVTILFLVMKLETVIQADKIEVRLYPFHLSFRQYPSTKIDSAYVKTYDPISDFGGWGLRTGSFKTGNAFNVSGNQGIQLVFKDGSKLLIGTQKPNAAGEALQKAGYLTKKMH